MWLLWKEYSFKWKRGLGFPNFKCCDDCATKDIEPYQYIITRVGSRINGYDVKLEDYQEGFRMFLKRNLKFYNKSINDLNWDLKRNRLESRIKWLEYELTIAKRRLKKYDESRNS